METIWRHRGRPCTRGEHADGEWTLTYLDGRVPSTGVMTEQQAGRQLKRVMGSERDFWRRVRELMQQHQWTSADAQRHARAEQQNLLRE